MVDKFVGTNKLRRDLAIGVLSAIAIVAALFSLGVDWPARGQALLAVHVSLVGILVANALPIVREVR